MGEINRRYRDLPSVVHNILLTYNGWLVGSAALWYTSPTVELPLPNDFDILVPPKWFMDACRLLREHSIHINSFGGLKAKKDGHTLDVMALTFDEFLTRSTGVKRGKHAAIRMQPFAIVQWED